MLNTTSAPPLTPSVRFGTLKLKGKNCYESSAVRAFNCRNYLLLLLFAPDQRPN
jgi:hypothetical protein